MQMPCACRIWINRFWTGFGTNSPIIGELVSIRILASLRHMRTLLLHKSGPIFSIICLGGTWEEKAVTLLGESRYLFRVKYSNVGWHFSSSCLSDRCAFPRMRGGRWGGAVNCDRRRPQWSGPRSKTNLVWKIFRSDSNENLLGSSGMRVHATYGPPFSLVALSTYRTCLSVAHPASRAKSSNYRSGKQWRQLRPREREKESWLVRPLARWLPDRSLDCN